MIWEELVQDLLQNIRHSMTSEHVEVTWEIAHRATFATWEWRRGMHILLT